MLTHRNFFKIQLDRTLIEAQQMKFFKADPHFPGLVPDKKLPPEGLEIVWILIL